MAAKNMWWNGKKFGNQVVALSIFPRGPRGSVEANLPAFGAASSGAKDVVLLPTEFGPFLQTHTDATLVCYDAATLHWLLVDHFKSGNDAESLKVLWAYSREARLIDIMLLDQHIRRYQGEDGTVASPLFRLIRRCTGTELPEAEIHRQVATACQDMSQDPGASGLELMSQVAAATFHAYEQLQVTAENIVQTVKKANELPELPLSDDAKEKEIAERRRKLVETILEERRQAGTNTAPTAASQALEEQSGRDMLPSFGLLGIGIDVQGAIALQQPGRPGLRLDHEQLATIRRENSRRFERASAQLNSDAEARVCFQWSRGGDGENLVARDEKGLPEYHPQALKVWLQGFQDKLCDIHNLPAAIPTTHRGDPSFDPERWGIWAACHRSLRAWRDLERSAQLDRYLDRASLHPTYEVVPVFRSREPDLLALRSLRVSTLRPSDGHCFVVVTMPLLKVYCFDAVYFPHRGRLAGYFLRHDDPLGKIAKAFHGRAIRAHEEQAPGAWSPIPIGQDIEADVRHWWELTEVLLETSHLGVPASLMSVLLEDYGVHGVSGGNVEWLRTLLQEVVFEINDLFNDDILNRLSRVLGVMHARGVDWLAEREHLGTTDAALRADLLKKRENRPVWQRIREAQRERSAINLTDDEIVDKVLRHQWQTRAGRVIGPAFYAQARREHVMLLADEVMKSVAYFLVAHDFPPVAVTDNQIVLEVPDAQATDGLVDEVLRVVSLAHAQCERLGLRAVARCRCCDHW